MLSAYLKKQIKNLSPGRLVFALVFAVSLMSSSFGSVLQYENKKINKVRIKGNKIITKTAIQNKLKTKAGQRLKKAIIIEDVKNLFDTGYFSNIEVSALRTPKRKLIILFQLEEKQRISSISYKGGGALSKKKLKELSKLKAYEFLDIQKLKTAVSNIQKGYEEKGYFLTQVSYKLKENKKDRTTKVIINIKESGKALIKKIDFVGNKNISAKKIKSFFANKEKGVLSWITGSGIYKEEHLKRDSQVIRHLYLEEGFLEVKVSEPVVTLSPNKDGIYISYTVEEGPRFSVGQMDFAGDLILSKVELRKDLPLEAGDKFVYSRLQNSLRMIQTKYGDKGYAFANVIPRFAPEENTVHILFEIQKGEKVHIHRIHITGNHITVDKVIRRMMSLVEGDLYSASRRQASRGAIRRLGSFEEVDILNKTLENYDNKINLEVFVKEKENLGMFQAGGGINSSSGFFANAELNKTNLFGLGLTAGVQFMYLPGKEFLLNMNYVDPYFLDSDWYFGVDVFAVQKIKDDAVARFFRRCFSTSFCFGDDDPDSPPAVSALNQEEEEWSEEIWERYNRQFLKNQKGAKLTLGRWFFDNTIRLNSTLGIEDVEFAKVRDESIFKVSEAEGLRAILGASLEYDKRDDRIFPKNGVFSNFSLEWTRQFFRGGGFSKQFLQTDFIFRYYKELFWTIVWKNNVQAGFIHSLTDGKSIPFDKLYLLGGPRSLRGFSENTVGPRRKSQYKNLWLPYGGTKQIFYNMEFQISIIPRAKFYGLTFFDIGWVDNDISVKNIKQDAGIGLLILTPLGPFNLKWGWPLPLGSGEQQIHFSFGADF